MEINALEVMRIGVLCARTREDLRQLANGAEHLTDETIRTAKRGVDSRTDTNETAWHSKLQMVVLGVQRDDATEDRLALVPALRILGDDAGTDLDLHAEAQDTRQDRATSDTTLELVDLGTGLVDVEGTDDDEPGIGSKVAHGDGDALHDVFVDSVDVVSQLGGDGHNGSLFGDGT